MIAFLATLLLSPIVSFLLAAVGGGLAEIAAVRAPSGNAWEIWGFSSALICMAIPLVLSGAILGRVFPRSGWLLSLLFSCVPFLGIVEVGFSRTHAVVLPVAAIAGWAAGAYAKTWRKAWQPSAAALAVVFICGIAVGKSDRDWLVAQARHAACGFGAELSRPFEVSIEDHLTFFPLFPVPGLLPARVEAVRHAAQTGEDTFEFVMPSSSVRWRDLSAVWASRSVAAADRPAWQIRTLDDALTLARRARVPERLLAGPWKERPDADGVVWRRTHGKGRVFESGPDPGTWQRPHMIASSYGLSIELGRDTTH